MNALDVFRPTIMTEFLRSKLPKKPEKALRLRTSRRLHAQRLVSARMAEKRFVDAVVATKPTQEHAQRAEVLIRASRQAKEAHFLERYRATA